MPIRTSSFNKISVVIERSRKSSAEASSAWLEIGGKKHYFRSKWERNYARWLHYQKMQGWIKNWEYEPKTFWFEEVRRGVRSYKPDFYIIEPGKAYWVEVKGYMDPRSQTKLKRFRKYYPEENIKVVDGKWFSSNNHKMKIIINDWE